MANYHNFEYQIHKKTLFRYFLFTVFMCSIGLYLNLSVTHLPGDKVNSALTLNARDLFVFCNTDFDIFMRNQYIVYISFFDLHLLEILIAYVIVKVKSKADVLQGISKLDHLLKVSVF
jgi:hypothetical protein